MTENHRPLEGAPLGKAADYDRPYDSGLLFPIPRAEGRDALGLREPLLFSGFDLWQAWEVSWLDEQGKPAVAWGTFRVPADTSNIIESKSLKLYLNSLNQERLGDLETVRELIQRDLSATAGGVVKVELYPPGSWPTRLAEPPGICLDTLPLQTSTYHPAPNMLRLRGRRIVEESFHSHLLRSLCPVTGQPDWGGLVIRYRGPAMDPEGLLGYIVSFRQHQDFHEQCVERMFCEITERCRPEALSIQARYLRRGGLDINPFRSSCDYPPDEERWFLQ